MEANIKDNFIENREEILEKYKEIKILIGKLNADTPFKSELTEDINYEIGNLGEIIFSTVENTGYIKKLLEKDNKNLYSQDGLSVYGYNPYSKAKEDDPDKIAQESFFGVFEEGMCLRATNLCNLMAHCLKNEELEIGKKLKLKAVDINDIRTSNNVSGILDNATLLRDATEYHFDMNNVDEELSKDEYDVENEDIAKVHAIMQRSGMGKKGFTKKQTLDFVEALKINELKQAMYNSKGLTFKAVIHNLSSKAKYVRQLRDSGEPQEKIDEYNPEVALLRCKETSKSYTVKGKSTVRICASVNGDVHPTQFHLTDTMIKNIEEDLSFPIEEYEELLTDFPVSCAIAKNDAHDPVKRKSLFSDITIEERETDSFKSFDPFSKIKLLIEKVRKVREYNKNSKEEVGNEGR